MLAVARRMLRSEDDARDAVQEAFISAFKAIADFQGDARLSTWLHRIVVNAALMRLRRQRRKPEESIDELLPHFDERGSWSDGEQPCRTPSELLERSETRAVVHECTIDCRTPTAAWWCCVTSRSSIPTRRPPRSA